MQMSPDRGSIHHVISYLRFLLCLVKMDVEETNTSCEDGDHVVEADTQLESSNTVSSCRSSSKEEIMKAMAAVERDSTAIAQSFTSLFTSLRLSLSQASSSTVDHMNCFTDAAGHLQECVLDASTKGNHYINSCLRLNEEMKGMGTLASQLKYLRRHVDALDSAVNKITRFP